MCKKRFELIIAKYLKRIRVAPLRWRCTFKMTSRVTWWCHPNKIIWQTSRDGHLNVRQVGSRSEMKSLKVLPGSKTHVILWRSEILNIQKSITNQRMTSLWRNFRFLLFSPMSTYPPTFITIEHTLICVSKNHVFDDVIMTSRIFYKVGCIPIT